MDLRVLKAEYFDIYNGLEMFKKKGVKAAATDFYLLTGGDFYDGANDSRGYIEGGKNLSERSGTYWIERKIDKEKAKLSTNEIDICAGRYIETNGNICVCSSSELTYRYVGGYRLAMPFSNSSVDPSNTTPQRGIDGIMELEYGFYPQMAASIKTQKRLEKAYNADSLVKTGNCYTVNEGGNNGLKIKIYKEYKYEGKRYIRVNNVKSRYLILSNKEWTSNVGYPVWVEVQPVKWFIDEKEKIMVTEKILFSGIPFALKEEVALPFEDTLIKRYLDSYVSKELLQNNHKFYDQDGLLNDCEKYSKLRERINNMTKEKQEEFLMMYAVNIQEDEFIKFSCFIRRTFGENVGQRFDNLWLEQDETRKEKFKNLFSSESKAKKKCLFFSKNFR